ncbi:MAG: anti-sigma factor family protein [bacterium]
MNCKDARELMLEVMTTAAPPDVRRVLIAHLDECAPCRTEASRVEEMVTLLRALPDPVPPPGYWPEFMATLERRVAEDGSVLGRVARWLRTPRMSWTAAVATAVIAVVIALTFTVMSPPDASVSTPVTGLVTESVRQAAPGVQATLTLWNNGLTGVEVPYDFRPGGR